MNLLNGHGSFLYRESRFQTYYRLQDNAIGRVRPSARVFPLNQLTFALDILQYICYMTIVRRGLKIRVIIL